VDGLQNGLKQWGSSITLARDGIRSLIPGMSGSDAATALESVTQQALGKLIANCGLKQDTLLSFLYDGTLPAGKTADNLLLGSCSGTPLQVAANLGEGQNFTSDTLTAARDRYLKCLNDDFGQQRCNDPRADDAPVDDNNPVAPDSSESTCTQFSADGPDGSLICTDPQVNQLEQIEAALAGTGIVISEDEAQQILYDSQVAHDTALAARAAGYADNVLTVTGLGTLGTGTAAKIEFGSAVTTGALTTAAAVLGYVTSAAKFVSWGCKNYPEQCGAAIRRSADYAHCDPMGFCYGPEGVRKPSGSNKMCAPDFDTGGAGWYQTDGKPSASRQLTQDDRINHCTCELLDAKYSGRASSLKASVGCPIAAEPRRVAGQARVPERPQPADQPGHAPDADLQRGPLRQRGDADDLPRRHLRLRRGVQRSGARHPLHERPLLDVHRRGPEQQHVRLPAAEPGSDRQRSVVPVHPEQHQLAGSPLRLLGGQPRGRVPERDRLAAVRDGEAEQIAGRTDDLHAVIDQGARGEHQQPAEAARERADLEEAADRRQHRPADLHHQPRHTVGHDAAHPRLRGSGAPQ
jgi:hypothetical protein